MKQRHFGVEVDKAELEFVCQDDNGTHRWYYDRASDNFLCLNEKTQKCSYVIPFKDFPTEEDLMARKMRRYVREGVARYIPPEVLKAKCSTKSQAVMRISEFKKKRA